jgi:YidC/Oxa1 family membrane protein insertase
VWWTVIGVPLSTSLAFIYGVLHQVPLLNAIGAYGIAIIIITIGIKTILSPLFEIQIRAGKRTMEQQRKLAPELAELRKKHKGDPQKQQAATMELYRSHGINPLANMTGCLPAIVQIPILSALYWVFFGNAQHGTFPDHFLFIPHLDVWPKDVLWFSGLPIPAPAYLVLPLLAGLTTFIQSRMMQQPPNPAASEQEQQTQSMMKSMQVVMPLMIIWFAIITPAGLALYWTISNLFAIGQQYRVNGWGGLRPAVQRAKLAAATAQAGSAPARQDRQEEKVPAKRSTANRQPQPQQQRPQTSAKRRSAKRTRKSHR